MIAAPVALLLALVVALACALAGGCAEPVYDADIGVEGIPVETGALAGSFAVLVQATDKSNVPGLEDEVGGGFTIYLVERTFDGATGYAQQMSVCQVNNFEVAGLTTIVSEETALAIPPITASGAAIVDATGAVAGVDFIEVWAVDDRVGATEALPETPDDPNVVDMEGDGKPGATLTASGLANGEIYVVNRKTLSLAGVVRGPDESFGLTTHLKEGFVLEATDPILDVDAKRFQHPDPKESWWHEVRVDEPSCAAVQRALDDGVLTRLRPFT